MTKKDAASDVASLASGFTSGRDARYPDFHLPPHPNTSTKLAQPNIRPYPRTGANPPDHLLTFKGTTEEVFAETNPWATVHPGVIRTNATKTMKNFFCNVAFQIESSCRMQPANIAHEALESQLVLGALHIILTQVLHSATKLKQREPKEVSDRDDDLDLD